MNRLDLFSALVILGLATLLYWRRVIDGLKTIWSGLEPEGGDIAEYESWARTAEGAELMTMGMDDKSTALCAYRQRAEAYIPPKNLPSDFDRPPTDEELTSHDGKLRTIEEIERSETFGYPDDDTTSQG